MICLKVGADSLALSHRHPLTGQLYQLGLNSVHEQKQDTLVVGILKVTVNKLSIKFLTYNWSANPYHIPRFQISPVAMHRNIEDCKRVYLLHECNNRRRLN